MNRIHHDEMQRLAEASGGAKACANCFLRARCLIPAVPVSVELRQHVLARGEVATVRGGASRIVVVRGGALKTRVWTPHGRECVLGFFESGDPVGLPDAVPGLDVQLVALESSRICEVDMRQLPQWLSLLPETAARVRAALADELTRALGLQMALGGLSVRERLAGFIVEQASRQRQRGLRDDVLLLRMSREDIGNHLGARLETVSREFGALQRLGLIALRRRELRVLDTDALCELAGRGDCARR